MLFFKIYEIPAYSALIHVAIETARDSFNCRLAVLLTILITTFVVLRHLKLNLLNLVLTVRQYCFRFWNQMITGE